MEAKHGPTQFEMDARSQKEAYHPDAVKMVPKHGQKKTLPEAVYLRNFHLCSMCSACVLLHFKEVINKQANQTRILFVLACSVVLCCVVMSSVVKQVEIILYLTNRIATCGEGMRVLSPSRKNFYL